MGKGDVVQGADIGGRRQEAHSVQLDVGCEKVFS
jgi:hypothetical protein